MVKALDSCPGMSVFKLLIARGVKEYVNTSVPVSIMCCLGVIGKTSSLFNFCHFPFIYYFVFYS